ncbi:MAG: glycosyltransferase family 2 protein [Bryobacteraceae bacterium]
MISIVIPIYNEEVLVAQLNAEIHRVMASSPEPWEVIYVNDGSSDKSLELLMEIHERFPKTVVVADLSRNWGHQAAITAGVSLAKGAATIIMDGDFQDPPALIPEMVAAWKRGAEVVIARRTARNESGIRRFLFPLFYRLLGYLSDYPIPLDAGVFGLMDRRACAVISSLQETNRFLPGLRSWIGFRTVFIDFERPARAGGEPKQTFVRLVKYAFDAILSFSYKPLRIGLAFGVTMAFLSIVAALVLAIMRVRHLGIFRDNIVMGYASLMCTVLLMASVQLICTGILGEYTGRIYDEVKRRPLFVIRNVLDRVCTESPQPADLLQTPAEKALQ